MDTTRGIRRLWLLAGLLWVGAVVAHGALNYQPPATLASIATPEEQQRFYERTGIVWRDHVFACEQRVSGAHLQNLVKGTPVDPGVSYEACQQPPWNDIPETTPILDAIGIALQFITTLGPSVFLFGLLPVLTIPPLGFLLGRWVYRGFLPRG